MVYFLNGKYVSQNEGIPFLDRGLFLGDGVFETVKILQGEPVFWKEHLERLVQSLKKLCFPDLNSQIDLKQVIQKLAYKNQNLNAIARIIVTRGVYEYQLDIKDNVLPHIMIALNPIKIDVPNSSLTVVTQKVQRGSQFADLKTLNYLPQIMAKHQAQQQGFDDALWVNQKEELLELTSSNLFCVLDNELVTPKLNGEILPGIIRQKIIDYFRKDCSLSIKEIAVTLQDLPKIKEAFVTSSIRGVFPIAKINQQIFNSSNLIEELQAKITLWEEASI